ncbi:unnamed protein product [Amoebophrya sp. A120]|nr:unnamed protein product [Amoebophrya sp. A120]|eukprot:GSA120T00014797001.1
MLANSISDKLKSALRDNLKYEDNRDFVNPWQGDKSTLLLEARAFHATPIDTDKCCRLITKILYMLFQGQRFSGDNMTDLFFGVTKLFQSSSPKLRRLTYLVIKNLEPAETEAFIVTSSLIKDVNSKTDCNRANAIRVLSKILDVQIANQIADRYLKTAIVDKNPFVASSSLVCGISLTKMVPEVIKRWVNEIQETVLSSGSSMVQYHALALLYEIKKNDRLGLHKVITNLAKNQLKNPMAECLLIRYAANALMAPDRDPGIEKPLIAYIDSCLKAKQKAEMVTHEAARAFVNLIISESKQDPHINHLFGVDFARAVDILQIGLTSAKPVMRFAAARTLNQLAQHRPELVTRCNQDMEPLLSDPNRSTATLALTSLLKTGNESNVERLVKQITSFMSDITDVFKIEVVRAVKSLGLQYPTKYKVIMHFLSTNLREEGSLDFKKDLVEAMVSLIQYPKMSAVAQKEGLLHLCEFIEDCEYPDLCMRILAFLGENVPLQQSPGKFVRFMYNRLILENALVRAAAADALTKVGLKVPSLRSDIATLLECGKNDNDDEVRDRINLYKSSLLQQNPQDGDYLTVVVEPLKDFSVDALFDLCEKQMSVPDLRNKPIDVSNLPTPEAYAQFLEKKRLEEQKEQGLAGHHAQLAGGAPGETTGVSDVAAAVSKPTTTPTEVLSKIAPLFGGNAAGAIGNLLSCTKPTPVTELEAEYSVQLIKHIFQRHIVLEFYITNTLEGVGLADAEVQATILPKDADKFSLVGSVKASEVIQFNENKSSYLVLEKKIEGIVAASLPCKLCYNQLEDGDDIGFPDETQLENAEILPGNYVSPALLPPGQVKPLFEQLKAQGSAMVKLQLEYNSIEKAVEGVINTMGMEACEKTDTVDPSRTAHELWLSGTFAGGFSVVCRALIGKDNQGRILMQLTAACKNKDVADCVAGFLKS